MTSVRIIVDSDSLGSNTIEAVQTDRELGDSERDCIERCLREAVLKIRQSYELDTQNSNSKECLVKVTITHPNGHEQEAAAAPGGHIKFDLRKPSP